MESLIAKHNANSLNALDAAIEVTPDFRFGHWSSWGYHDCKNTPQDGCGEGRIKRSRRMADGKTETESRPCSWKNDDGEPIECEEITETGDFEGKYKLLEKSVISYNLYALFLKISV